jgi:hypothetical protein
MVPMACGRLEPWCSAKAQPRPKSVMLAFRMHCTAETPYLMVVAMVVAIVVAIIAIVVVIINRGKG